eukprot:scaffold269587_cov30-Tisochrysis_lutea.AAC.1
MPPVMIPISRASAATCSGMEPSPAMPIVSLAWATTKAIGNSVSSSSSKLMSSTRSARVGELPLRASTAMCEGPASVCSDVRACVPRGPSNTGAQPAPNATSPQPSVNFSCSPPSPSARELIGCASTTGCSSKTSNDWQSGATVLEQSATLRSWDSRATLAARSLAAAARAASSSTVLAASSSASLAASAAWRASSARAAARIYSSVTRTAAATAVSPATFLPPHT